MEQPGHPRVRTHSSHIAILGGDARQRRRFAHVVGATFYPSAGDGGPHHVQRLIESIRHGGVSQVFILARWIGHSASGRIRVVARRHGVPVSILAGVQAPRLNSSSNE